MKSERFARWLVVLIGMVALGVPLIGIIGRSDAGAIDLRGRMADDGGWTPSDLTVAVGQPLRLRLTSDDVTHGFAIGQSDRPAIDVLPGQVTETTLVFDKPGKYTFYCTRWCGVNHWRMRGTIEVTGSTTETVLATKPLYLTLGLNIDDPHPSEVIPGGKPSAARGTALGVMIPPAYLTLDSYRAQSPSTVWRELRASSFSNGLSGAQIWDLVAVVWRSNTTSKSLGEGKKLYAENCAACHGETGHGDGVMAAALNKQSQMAMGHETQKPVDFTDAQSMLGASSAILQGKIMRGGMGTGMPYWGPIFTESQIWSLVDYLWTFQFEEDNPP